MSQTKLDIEKQFGRTLVAVAHPDDEAIGCGVLLQRLSRATVAFMTDGAPADRYFWGKFGSRNAYADVRARESASALEGFESVTMLRFGAPDQELMFHLEIALDWLRKVITEQKPQTIVTHAYEGGHPDHDCCSFLCSVVAGEYGLPVWEMPLYSRNGDKLVRQYLPEHSSAVRLSASDSEVHRKAEMVAAYQSQDEFLQGFDLVTEKFIAQRKHDFSNPPHAGKLNYECWGWEVAGSDLCSAFEKLMNKNRIQRAKCA
jgi:LmbE family N-acetylglucosaminyl deacetylase